MITMTELQFVGLLLAVFVVGWAVGLLMGDFASRRGWMTSDDEWREGEE